MPAGQINLSNHPPGLGAGQLPEIHALLALPSIDFLFLSRVSTNRYGFVFQVSALALHALIFQTIRALCHYATMPFSQHRHSTKIYPGIFL